MDPELERQAKMAADKLIKMFLSNPKTSVDDMFKSLCTNSDEPQVVHQSINDKTPRVVRVNSQKVFKQGLRVSTLEVLDR